MKKATYHQEPPAKPTRLTVLKDHGDGTVDLGHGEGDAITLVVGRCPLSDQPKVGHCVLVLGAAPEPVEAEEAEPEAEADAAPTDTAAPAAARPAAKKAAKKTASR